MNYKNHWEGSVIPEVKSGKATFSCGDIEIELYLDDFIDFKNICDLLDNVAEQTYYEIKANVISNVERLFKR